MGTLFLYLGMIIFLIVKNSSLSNREYIIYLALISPLSILIICSMLRFLNKESLLDLNLKESSLFSDLISAFLLSIVLLAANIVTQPLLSLLLPETDAGVRDLFLDMSENPGRFFLFLGPLVLLGAVSEELMRIFLLSRLWRIWPSLTGRLISVFISACLFGLLHLTRGPVQVAWTMIYGLLVAFCYMHFGRFLPLILAHYLTNAIQIVVTSYLLSG